MGRMNNVKKDEELLREYYKKVIMPIRLGYSRNKNTRRYIYG